MFVRMGEVSISCANRTESELLEIGLPIVRRMARRYQGTSYVSFDELVSAGYEGLVYALRCFDPEKGSSFLAWVRRWVRHYIQRLLRDLHPVACIPVEIRRLGLSILQENCRRRSLGLPLLGREEVSTYLGVREEAAVRAWTWVQEGGLNNFMEGDEDSLDHESSVACGRDLVDEVMESILSQEVGEAIRRARLSEKERVVIELSFGLGGNRPMSLREIGEVIGVTHQSVSYTLKQALSKLSNGDAGRILRQYTP